MFRKLFFCTLIASKTALCGQSIDNNEAWLSGSASFKIFKKTEFSPGFATRFNNNWSHLSSYMFQSSLSYKLNAKWKTELNYRYTNKKYTYSNRISVDLKWNDEIWKRTYLSIRPRIQRDIDLDNTRGGNTLRGKMELSYKIKKTKLYPAIYSELFYRLNRFENKWDRMRIGVNLDIKSIQNQTISIGFFKNYGLGNQISKNRNIFTLDYNIKL